MLQSLSWEEALQLAGWSPPSLANVLKSNPSTPVDKASTKKRASYSPNSPHSINLAKNAYDTPIQPRSKQIDIKKTPYDSFLEGKSYQMIDLTKGTQDIIECCNLRESEFTDNDQLSLVGLKIDDHACKINLFGKDNMNSFQSARQLLLNEANLGHQSVLSIDAILDTPLSNGWKLFDHQKQAIRHCIKLNRAILAYDMGLGKTIICLIWASIMCKRSPDYIAVVVAPCTLMETWRREAITVGFQCSEYSHGTKQWTSKTVINKKNKPRLILISWAKIPTIESLAQFICSAQDNFVLICDEAHAIQSMSSQRTQAALQLCLSSRCRGVILSTGTPMKNGRPSNLLPLLVAIRHPCARDRKAFETKYCNARKTRFCAWDTSGASNLDELRTVIGEYLIRKTKDECLDLPTIDRQLVEVTVLEEYRRQYESLIGKIRGSGAGHGSKGQRNGSALELLGKLRQLSSLAKACPVADVIRKRITNGGGPVVVFVWFRETAWQLQRALSQRLLPHEPSPKCNHEAPQSNSGILDSDDLPIRCDVLTGDITKQHERQALVDSFQAGHIDVLVCSYGVGSTGITLTRSHVIVLLDRPWTPGDVSQVAWKGKIRVHAELSAVAEDRVRRIGQTATTISSLWITAFPLDSKIDQLLQDKGNSTRQVLDKNSGVARPDSSSARADKSVSKANAKGSGQPVGKGILAYLEPCNRLLSFVSNGENDAGDKSNAFARQHNADVKKGGDEWNVYDVDDNKVTETSIMQTVLSYLLQK